MRQLPLSDVTIDDPFWTPRQELVRTLSIPHQEKQLREQGAIDALALTWTPDQPPLSTFHLFWESDTAKWIEAASYSLVHHPDPTLDAALDDVIARLAGAQQPDGYLNNHFTQVDPQGRFRDLHDAHELYCLGHLVEAAVAHHRATGKTSLLDIVTRYLDLVEREFGEGGPLEGGYCGHEEIELALVRLADLTGDEKYLRLASRFVEARGTEPFWFEDEARRLGGPGYFGSALSDDPEKQVRLREYNQSHAPVRDQHDAVGHSVRAMYLYSAMADLAARLEDRSLTEACERLWQSTTQRRMYVTGGIGADASIEGFRGDFDLPNDISYNETCASIGLVMWAHRMALLTGEGRYLDVLELALYNTVLAGGSSDGTHYFYGNPMQSDGQHARSGWFDCACCPPNFARLLTSLGSYAYAASGDTLAVHLFVSGTARADLDSGPAQITVTTQYPWQGRIAIRVDEGGDFALAVHIPAWAEDAVATVAGQPVEVEVVDGFWTIRRPWAPGDEVVLELPMDPTRVWADPRVTATAGLVTLQRGPLVHCVESLDPQVPAASVALPRSSALSLGWDDALAVPVVTAVGRVDESDASQDETGVGLYRDVAPMSREVELTAIPYFAWGNRGPSTMRVWLRDLT